jgi:hypothetical protein
MVPDLEAELRQTDAEITEATATDVSLAGGLLKTLVGVRLEILRTSRALLRQRILAETSGASLTVQIPATTPDPYTAKVLAAEIQSQQRILEAARADAARFAGGLVHALKLTTVATQEQTLSMLHQRYLVARFGLGVPTPAVTSATEESAAIPAVSPSSDASTSPGVPAVFTVRLLKKQFTKQSHQDFIFFDTEFTASGLKRPARAIKGQLMLNDLSGETQMTIGWTLNQPLSPGDTLVERAKGFHYNQFLQPHQWVNSTAIENMSPAFAVNSILYQDGTREDF